MRRIDENGARVRQEIFGCHECFGFFDSTARTERYFVISGVIQSPITGGIKHMQIYDKSLVI